MSHFRKERAGNLPQTTHKHNPRTPTVPWDNGTKLQHSVNGKVTSLSFDSKEPSSC